MNPEKKIRCAVVDDEPLAAALIASYVRRTSFLELVAEINHSSEALALALGGGVDLMFLDIHMPGMDGMTLAARLPSSTRVVFTTAYSDHALEGYAVNALHYLLKPVSYEEFLQGASRALELREGAPAPRLRPEYLTVKSDYKVLRLPVDEIDFIEGLKDYIMIYSGGSTKPVVASMSMKAAEEALEGADFMRVHRSFIVNLAHVRVVERNCILLNGRAIPVSDTCRKRFATAIGLE